MSSRHVFATALNHLPAQHYSTTRTFQLGTRFNQKFRMPALQDAATNSVLAVENSRMLKLSYLGVILAVAVSIFGLGFPIAWISVTNFGYASGVVHILSAWPRHLSTLVPSSGQVPGPGLARRLGVSLSLHGKLPRHLCRPHTGSASAVRQNSLNCARPLDR